MPRRLRDISQTGYYHVTARGNDKKDIYYNANDKVFFLNLLRKIKVEFEIRVLSYCLMDNHFHLLIYDPSAQLSEFMKLLLQSYVIYFNGTYNKSGRLFGDRFYSRSLVTQTDIERTIRYIHNNPVKAHISPANQYPWSSYNEFLSSPKYCDIIDTFELIGGINGFRSIMETIDPMDCLVSTNPSFRTDEEVRNILEFLISEKSATSIDQVSNQVQSEIFKKLREYKVSVEQIARVSGLSTSAIRRRLSMT